MTRLMPAGLQEGGSDWVHFLLSSYGICAKTGTDAQPFAEGQDCVNGNGVVAVLKECLLKTRCEPRGGTVMLHTAVATVRDSGVAGHDGVPACQQKAVTQTLPTLASRRPAWNIPSQVGARYCRRPPLSTRRARCLVQGSRT